MGKRSKRWILFFFLLLFVQVFWGNVKVVQDDMLLYAATNKNGDEEEAYVYEVQKDGTIAILEYVAKDKEVIIPDSINGRTVSSIGTGAFIDCNWIEKVEIPDSVEKICTSAFTRCSNLKSVRLSDNIESIGAEAFWKCESLEEIVLPSQLQEIGSYAFACCSSLQEIQIPQKVTKINSYAFKQCKNVKQVTLPDGLRKIGAGAFMQCEGLERIQIPEQIDRISKNTFQECWNMREVTLPDGLRQIGEGAFSKCGSLENIILPESIETIGRCAFQYCGRLKEIHIPHKVKYIQPFTFSSCVSLHKIDMEDGNVEKIGYCAFADCRIFSITFPDCLRELEMCAFLDSIYMPEKFALPEKLEKIGDGALGDCTIGPCILLPKSVCEVGSEALTCKGLKEIQVEEGNLAYSTYKGALYNLDQTKLIVYPRAAEQIELAENTTKFEAGCFSYCLALQTFALPEGTEIVKESLFSDCINLTRIEIPESVKEIEDCAFFECEALKEITLPEQMDKIGDGVFYGCTALEEIRLPKQVCKIEDEIFNMCTNLKKVVFECAELEMTEDSFDGCDSLEEVTVPANGVCYFVDGYETLKEIYCHDTKEQCSNLSDLEYAENRELVIHCLDGDIDLSKDVVMLRGVTLANESFAYSGKARTPAIHVYDKDGNLIDPVHYTVTYKNNVELGTATVVAQGKGNYIGTVKADFIIVPKAVSIKKIKAQTEGFQVAWNSATGEVNGFEIQYSTHKNFSKAESIFLENMRTTTRTIRHLSGNKKYYVRVRTFAYLEGEEEKIPLYSEWSKTMQIKTKK